MGRRLPRVGWQATTSQPIVVGNTRITLESRALAAEWLMGGLVWQRPWAAHIEAGGRARRIPIRDITRLIELGLLGLGLAIVAVAAATRQKEHTQ